MKKYCENCGYSAENEGENFCPECGGRLKEAERVTAEWGTDEVQKIGVSPVGESDLDQDGEQSALNENRADAVRLTRIAGGKKKLFLLAFVGLLLDFLYGVGGFLCLPVAVFASRDSLWLYKKEKKFSTQLVWAMVVGYLGAVLGLVFFVLMI